MSTSILKLEASVIRPKDDDELDGLWSRRFHQLPRRI